MSVDFKLFGNFLSLREFLFIATGLAVAWFFWFLMQQGIIPGLIAVPISFIVGGGGILMGLVPINDKSLDKWILIYFSAIRRPTQRVWRKAGYQPDIASSNSLVVTKDFVVTPPSANQGIFSSAPLTKTTQQQPDQATIKAETAEIDDLKRLDSSFAALGQNVSNSSQGLSDSTAVLESAMLPPTGNGSESPATAIPTTSFSANSELSGTVVLTAGKEAITAGQEATSPQSSTVQNLPSSSATDLFGGLSGSVSFQPQAEKTQPDDRLSASATVQSSQFSNGQFPPGIRVIPPTPQQNVPLVIPEKSEPSQTQGSPFPPRHQAPTQTHVIVIDDKNISNFATTIPGLEDKLNTINVVVKDTKGLIMPGVVCVIKNVHGDPVRAAISNILGQIINNIPLKDGMYKVNLTKQGYVFPEVTRALSGKIYPPIEIKSL